MKIGEFYQQGDVIIERVGSIPKGKEVQSKERGFVLAEGETTGHAHVITATNDVYMVQTDTDIYLHVKRKVPLKHEEHTFIEIEPGDYKIRKVMERDHFSRITREVLD